MNARQLRTLCLTLLLGGLGCSQVTLKPQGPLSAHALAETDLNLSAATDPDRLPATETMKVSTVESPQAPRRPLSLAECIALALENGRTGEFYDRVGSDRQTSATGLQQGPASSSTDSVRVFAVDPAAAATEVEQALARFDAIWTTSATWSAVQPPPGVSPDQIPIIGVGVVNRQLDNVQFRSSILKPLPTGGVAGFTIRTDYGRANVDPGSPVINPAYQPGVEWTFEQPLLQGAGVFINEVRETLPTPLRAALPSQVVPAQTRTPAILLARMSHDQARLEFERRVQTVLLAVEEAYWDLYSAYWDLYTRDSGLRQAQLAWQIGKERFDAGGLAQDELAQLEEQYHLFRTQRLESLGRGNPGRPGVLEAERRLRYVVGLPAEDGTRLIPTDAPLTAPVSPDWQSAVAVAQQQRPELRQVRVDVEAAQMALARAEDYLLPDLRFYSRYGLNGLDDNLGTSVGNVVSKNFSNWDLGLQLQVPIGRRAAHAEVTRAKLRLAQRLEYLREQEGKVLLSLQRSYRDVVQFREELTTRHSQREAVATQLQVRFKRFEEGKENIDLLVRTQRQWADALRDEYAAVCRYNVALADFERQKGTILAYHNVTLAEGGVPGYAQGRASKVLCAFNQKKVSQQVDQAKAQQNATEAAGLPVADPARILTYLEEPAQVPYAPPARSAPASP